jgi:hypothetical protein
MQKTQAFLLSRGLALAALIGTSAALTVALTLLAPAPAPPAEAAAEPEAPLAPVVDSALVEVESTQPETCQLAVRTTRDGQALDGAHVSVRLVGQHGTKSRWEAITQDGAHRFVDLPRGTYHVSVTSKDRAARTGPPVECDGDESRFFLDLDLTAMGTPLTVSPRSTLGALPEGAEVLVAQEAGAQEGVRGVLHLERTGDSFHAYLRPGRYEVMTVAPHHASVKRSIIVDEVKVNVRPKLTWRPEASGQVVDATGNPVANARIYLGPRLDPKMKAATTRTDDDGRFVLPVPASTNLVLTARAPDGIATVELGVPQRPAGHPDVVLQLGAGRDVTGWVTQRNGAAHAFGKVRYRVKALGMEGVVKADEEGAFRLPQMPDLDVELWAADSAIGAWGGRVSSLEAPKVLLQWVSPAYAQQ